MKRIFSLLLALALLLSLPMTASAARTDAADAAQALYELGLFKGVGENADGSVNFDLDGAADRQTAVTMIIRIIGKDSEAVSGTWSVPFSDYDGWAAKYVGYAYNKGITTGTGANTFGGKSPITAQQYITFTLRCLGYGDADFSYATACDFATRIRLTDGSYTNSTSSFTRGDIAIISYTALGLKVKGSALTLQDSIDTPVPTKQVEADMIEQSGTPSIETPIPTEDESLQPLTNSPPAVSTVLEPVASGTTVYTGNGASIDASNAGDGYVMVKFASAGAKLKVIVYGPTTKYTYNLNNAGNYEVFPLSDGNGAYTVAVYKNTTGTKYSTIFSQQMSVSLDDEFAPFLRPNQYVNYTSDSTTVAYAAQLTADCATELEKVQVVYNYVINNLTYDTVKADTVQSGYLPDVDEILSLKKGICFDYAAVMAAMLRSQGIPTKLVVGYAGTAYHAWISVYTDESGWVEQIIYFDGYSWKLMDPTFASSAIKSDSYDSIMNYIGDGTNYSAKYLY